MEVSNTSPVARPVAVLSAEELRALARVAPEVSVWVGLVGERVLALMLSPQRHQHPAAVEFLLRGLLTNGLSVGGLQGTEAGYPRHAARGLASSLLSFPASLGWMPEPGGSWRRPGFSLTCVFGDP